MQVLQSFFEVGVFDPLAHDSWPWDCHLEYGTYLSKEEEVVFVEKCC